jgi:hypothetical protein
MKFSIRDLLLVTVIVTLATGWWLDRSRLQNAIYDAVLLGPDPPGTSNQNISSEIIDQLRKRKPLNSSAPAPNPPNP